MSLNRDMDKAIVEFATATDQLHVARRFLAEAQNRECSAVNRVNEAQKALDAVYSQIRKEAPWGTDWVRPVGQSE